MKLVITQNDRNHSNFYLEMAVLGLAQAALLHV